MYNAFSKPRFVDHSVANERTTLSTVHKERAKKMTAENINITIYRDGLRDDDKIVSTGHGDTTPCGYCSHAPKGDATGCWCPSCVDTQEVEDNYPSHVEYHGMAPPHVDGMLESMCDFVH